MKNRKELQETWRRRIADYRDSGLSASEWCEKSGVPISSLKYWITRINKIDSVSNPGDVGWSEVVISETDRAGIVIRIGRFCIEVQDGFDVKMLADVLKVTGSIC
jgi:hypothetical protein